MTRNHWITFPDDPVAEWDACFPPPRDDAERLVRFACLLVDAGKRHAVWDTRRFVAGAGSGSGTYETYVREALDQRQNLRLALKALDPEAPSMARLAFYRDDRIVEEDVADVGALLATLRPELSPMVTEGAPPITVLGFAVPKAHDKEVRFRIRLDTDIWFPRVTGMGDVYLTHDDDPAYANNRELAARHTPRFNAFLRELRAAALADGGRWDMERLDGFAANYLDQWDENGIAI